MTTTRDRVRRLAATAGVVLAVVAVLWLVRPGVVENGARSPRVWLAVVGVLLAGRLTAYAVRRATGRARAATVASSAAMALLGAALLAPSFQQRTLDEPFPALAAAPAPPGPAEPAAAPPVASPTPAAPVPVAAAELAGVGHGASGRVALHELDGRSVLSFEDVDVEGTPGPFVHLVPAGERTPDAGLEVGALKAERGSFSYVLPEGSTLRARGRCSCGAGRTPRPWLRPTCPPRGCRQGPRNAAPPPHTVPPWTPTTSSSSGQGQRARTSRAGSWRAGSPPSSWSTSSWGRVLVLGVHAQQGAAAQRPRPARRPPAAGRARGGRRRPRRRGGPGAP
jgi:hypothetical protein